MRGSSEPPAPQALIELLRDRSMPLEGSATVDALAEGVGNARCVLIGEASHGTSEYYTWRAAITRRLIENHGFSFVAVEGDWPDCYTVNRFVKDYPDAPSSAVRAAAGFDRWPTWMWANWEVASFVTWLRDHNRERAGEECVGFYGLDVYSLWDSLEAVVRFVEERAPEALDAARQAYQCFQPFGDDPQRYAMRLAWAPDDCRDEAAELLARLRQSAARFDGDGRDGAFDAEQNALVVRNAEAYYAAMVQGGRNSWNVRDRHMVETLERLMALHGPESKAVVWEHNTHVGDARATDMAAAGMVNVGQLVREGPFGDRTQIIGFAGYSGSVIAGSAWGAPMERMEMPAARSGSWEAVLHEAVGADALLFPGTFRDLPEAMQPRGHRAIGVVYDPAAEAYGNYVPTVLPDRYDAVLYFEQTMALHPLHGEVEEDKLPEQYPWAV